MSVQRLETVEVEGIALELANTFMEWNEPIPPFSSRLPNRLESCLATPFQSFDGVDLYPTLIDKAAILFYLMVKNHPFENGNKRMAVATLLLFLFSNKKWIEKSVEAIYQFAKDVAESDASRKDRTIAKIRDFIATGLTELPPGDD